MNIFTLSIRVFEQIAQFIKKVHSKCIFWTWTEFEVQRAGQLLQQLIRQSWHDYKYGMIGQINDCTKSLDKSLFLGIDSFHSNNWIESWLSSAIFDFFQILFEFWSDSKLLKRKSESNRSWIFEGNCSGSFWFFIRFFWFWESSWDCACYQMANYTRFLMFSPLRCHSSRHNELSESSLMWERIGWSRTLFAWSLTKNKSCFLEVVEF